MNEKCFVSGRIAGTCGNCRASASMVHCPRHLKLIACEHCCPICNAKRAEEAMQSIETKERDMGQTACFQHARVTRPGSIAKKGCASVKKSGRKATE
jgi:hypothetical protein